MMTSIIFEGNPTFQHYFECSTIQRVRDEGKAAAGRRREDKSGDAGRLLQQGVRADSRGRVHERPTQKAATGENGGSETIPRKVLGPRLHGQEAVFSTLF